MGHDLSQNDAYINNDETNTVAIVMAKRGEK